MVRRLVVAFLVLLFLASITSSIYSQIGAPADTLSDARATSVDPNSLTLTANPMSGYVGSNITFYANGSSYDPGANLVFTIYYDYFLSDFSINPESAVTVNATTSPGFVTQKHVYNQLGNFSDAVGTYTWVALFVEDGETNESVMTVVYLSIYVPPVNTPPWMAYLFAPPGARYGEPFMMSALVIDNQSDPVTMTWDFGDGTNATNTSTVTPVTFTQVHTWWPPILGEGGYNATFYLNVSVADGLHAPVNHSSIVSVQVPFYFPPLLQVIMPTPPYVQDKPILFEVNASAQFGDPMTWTFNYSDGHIDVFHTGLTAPNEIVWQNATHTFEAAGDYTVSVSVSDAPIPYQIGQHNQTISLLLTVQENTPPWIFTIDMSPGAPRINESIGYVNVTYTVQGFDADGDIITLAWDFGGGVTRTNVSSGGTYIATFIQVVEYSEPGNFTISVTATDGIPGHAVSRSRYANISSDDIPPELVFFDRLSPSGNVFPNDTVVVRVILTDRERDPLTFSLNFSDGSPMLRFANITNYTDGNITIELEHAFTTPGVYTIWLVVTDSHIGLLNHTKTYVLPVRVVADTDYPVAHAGPDQMVEPGTLVFFDGTSSSDSYGIVNYTWTFSYNGTLHSLYGPSPSFSFWSTGTFNVTLAVTDHGGHVNVTEVSILVAVAVPEFTGLAAPVLGMLATVIIVGLSRRYHLSIRQ